MLIDEVKSICSQLNIIPHKSKGQNFLIGDQVVNKIVDRAGIGSSDLVLEVGPGLGVLTEKLIDWAGEVVAVELDKKIISYLQSKFGDNKNFRLVGGDVLKLNIDDIFDKNKDYRIVSNLPYNITSHFLRVFMALDHHPLDMVLMLQQEVAERIVAPAGKMSKLSVMTQFYGEPEILFTVDKDNFWPKPVINSAVMKINLKDSLPKVDPKKFFKLVNIGFSARRKQLKNNLAGGLQISNGEAEEMLKKNGLNAKARAQDLTIDDWIKLTA